MMVACENVVLGGHSYRALEAKVNGRRLKQKRVR